MSADGGPVLTAEELYAKALAVREQAYCPHSRFAVGAALVASDGTLVTGVNVENASYPLTMCAERTAVFSAITKGLRSFSAIAIAAAAHTVPPCGACLQVLAEFAGEDMRVIYRESGSVVERPLSELLPYRFEFERTRG
jgi:cytidine deaminase